MTLKQYLMAGVVEQAIVLGVILPATGWWFSFFALSAVTITDPSDDSLGFDPVKIITSSTFGRLAK